MTHYSNDPAMVRVDIFKDTGKWYETLNIRWVDYNALSIKDAFRISLLKHFETEEHPQRFNGMWAICLHPHHRFAHPLMVEIGD